MHAWTAGRRGRPAARRCARLRRSPSPSSPPGRLPLACSCWLRGVNSLQGAVSSRLVGGLQCRPAHSRRRAGLLPWCRPLGVHLPLLLRRPSVLRSPHACHDDHTHLSLPPSIYLLLMHACMHAHDDFSSCSIHPVGVPCVCVVAGFEACQRGFA